MKKIGEAYALNKYHDTIQNYKKGRVEPWGIRGMPLINQNRHICPPDEIQNSIFLPRMKNAYIWWAH